MHFVKEIEKVEPFKLYLKFENGSLRTINMESKLLEWSKSDGSLFKQLLNPDYFSQVKLNKELETVYWENGIDFCPDMLFQWSESN
ncbi:MAG: hypothetical protein RL115_1732 [Bacteroidota bacterium]|jgi:hypothetical protein